MTVLVADEDYNAENPTVPEMYPDHVMSGRHVEFQRQCVIGTVRTQGRALTSGTSRI
jgi:hypothetical protein